jgi:peptide-methionine (S)-S-oxide reductase
MTEQQTAVFAGGCFWCTEAIFQRVKGVHSVIPGYAGGKMENPSYEDVSTGNTGHAESIQIIFNPKVVSYDTLLDIFFATHDPTTINSQGHDVGAQYRSIIFYVDEKQKSSAEEAVTRAQQNHKDLIVTLILPLEKFYEAEDYHKNYYNAHKDAAYCNAVIDPKIKKLFKEFPDITKKDS